jgi:uncharacterized membrane protein
MQNQATLLGHPLHQPLVAVPLGMLAVAVALDLMGLVAGGAGPMMAGAAYWVLALGIVAALAALPFGLIDPFAIPGRRRAARIRRLHALGNAVVAGLFIASWLLRRDSAQPPALALALSFGGAAIALATAWLDAPSSLDHPHQQAVEPR